MNSSLPISMYLLLSFFPHEAPSYSSRSSLIRKWPVVFPLFTVENIGDGIWRYLPFSSHFNGTHQWNWLKDLLLSTIIHLFPLKVLLVHSLGPTATTASGKITANLPGKPGEDPKEIQENIDRIQGEIKKWVEWQLKVKVRRINAQEKVISLLPHDLDTNWLTSPSPSSFSSLDLYKSPRVFFSFYSLNVKVANLLSALNETNAIPFVRIDALMTQVSYY